jgi:hypothetical protein
MKSCGGKWTGLIAAITVSLTICDGQQINLAPSGQKGFILAPSASLQKERNEQKAPSDFTFNRFTQDTPLSRSSCSGTACNLSPQKNFQYARHQVCPGVNPFGWQLNSFASSRGPPLMDPPHFS